MEKTVSEWFELIDYLPEDGAGYALYDKIDDEIKRKDYFSRVTIQLSDDEAALVVAAEQKSNEDDDYYGDEDEDDEDW